MNAKMIVRNSDGNGNVFEVRFYGELEFSGKWVVVKLEWHDMGYRVVNSWDFKSEKRARSCAFKKGG